MMPHVLSFKAAKIGVEVGETFEKVKVDRVVYGGSYLVKLNETVSAFLHKSHVNEVV